MQMLCWRTIVRRMPSHCSRKNREPSRADLEFVLGRAYAANGEPRKAAVILSNLYFNMPLSAEAPQAETELKA